MKRNIILGLFYLLPASSFSANDSSEVLFKRAHYSHIQMDFHYSGFMNVNSQFLGGIGETFNIVLNEKLALGLGLISGILPSTSHNEVDPRNKISSIYFSYLNAEYLARPRKILNFSFPLMFGYSSVSFNDTIADGSQIFGNYFGTEYYFHHEHDWVAAAGAYALLNLSHCLSFGAGTNYRYGIGGAVHESYFRNLTFMATLRYKINYKYMMKKQQDKWKEINSKTQ